MINKNFTYAIVGASNNPEKYGYKVLSDLRLVGYRAIPINPKEEEIQGVKAYKDIYAFDKKIDVVVFVVPPEVTRKILVDVLKLGIKKVWMQPGSESNESVEFCKRNGIDCIHNACIMLKK